MGYKQEHIELIENIIKNSPGFKGNESLFDDILSETLKRAETFFDSSENSSNVEVYLKRIAINVIVDTVKNSKKITSAKDEERQLTEEFKEVTINYETDEQGKIIYNIQLPALKNSEKNEISQEKIDKIKEAVIKLDKKNPPKKYKQIFELRFIKGLNTSEIAQKLELEEAHAKKAIIELFNEMETA